MKAKAHRLWLSSLALSNILIVSTPVLALPVDLVHGRKMTCRTSFSPAQEAVLFDLKIDKELSFATVFRTQIAEETFVTRLPTRGLDIEFELFANQVVNASPNIRSPKIRALSVEETRFFTLKLEDQHYNLYRRYVRVTEGELDRTQARGSISEFSRGVNSREYLDQIEFSSLPISFFTHSRAFLAKDPGHQNEDLRIFRRRWDALAPNVRDHLVQLLAPVLGVSNGEQLMETLLTRGAGMSADKQAQIVELVLSQIPLDVRVKVADTWALFTTLGISDFHDANWLIDQDEVMAIDLNYYRGNHLAPNARSLLEFDKQNLPLAGAPIAYPIKHLSREMLDFLNRLSAEQLQRLAKQNNFNLNPEMRDGILSRAQAIVRYHRDENYPALWP